MAHNPILEELYAAREKLLADAGGDVHKFLEGVREREAASGQLLKQVSHGTTNGTGTVEDTGRMTNR
ncbi:MAG: hypothetical protein GXP26_08350 [Planctomycetes bacterium]|nr:hypothetical protein [Planctomycetota bacterium]